LDSLYHYQAGQASLFYPARDGKGPLVPSLRLELIRQGVEDFDLLSMLYYAREKLLTRLPVQAKDNGITDNARTAIVSLVMVDKTIGTANPERLYAVRNLIGNELEVASKGPAVIIFPTRIGSELAITGYIEHGTQLRLNGNSVSADGEGKIFSPVSPNALAQGMRWMAIKGNVKKQWEWPGLQLTADLHN
jgi:hypothetical protein